MFRRFGYITGAILLVLVMTMSPFPVQTASAHGGGHGHEFVTRDGPELRLDGRLFRFAGTNNYYLMYKSQLMVDDVLETAAANDFRVMRTWGWLDIGTLDGSPPESTSGPKEGVYFQYWDGSGPAYNDGPDGLERLDYVVYRAGQLGIRLVIPFTNNWGDFGGMDQYVRWRGGQYHDDFYTDPAIREWYKNWIAHLLNRTNIYTGIQYKDDPTIMMWELANEPRCVGSGIYPRSDSCTTQTLIDWADDVSRFIKGIDRRHLVSVGDEGFYCTPDATDWTENCNEGVDTIAFARLRHIDVMSFHLYPDSWGKDAAWGTQWIERHFRDARRLRKPAMLGEFGIRDESIRNPVYKEWTDTVLENHGSGALYWILSGLQDDGTYYPDYDHYTVYSFDPVYITLGNFAQMMNANHSLPLPPVADNDVAITAFETPATLTPAANDVAYGRRNEVVAATIDLDPSAAGQQTTISVTGGTFVLQPDSTVLYTPAPGFFGVFQTPYTIKDSRGRLSNAANLNLTVIPPPAPPWLMFSFEDGIDGWGDSWEHPGDVWQDCTWATEGICSLRADTVNGGWFRTTTIPAPHPGYTLADYAGITFDIRTLGAGTSVNLAFAYGDAWTWCQGGFTWVPANTTTTVSIDLLQGLSCSASSLSDLRAIMLFASGSTSFNIDNVVASSDID
jgi:mannan endo-1,4-beta-mannosidase